VLVEKERKAFNVLHGDYMHLRDGPSASMPTSEVENVSLLRARHIPLFLDIPNHT